MVTSSLQKSAYDLETFFTIISERSQRFKKSNEKSFVLMYSFLETSPIICSKFFLAKLLSFDQHSIFNLQNPHTSQAESAQIFLKSISELSCILLETLSTNPGNDLMAFETEKSLLEIIFFSPTEFLFSEVSSETANTFMLSKKSIGKIKNIKLATIDS